MSEDIGKIDWTEQILCPSFWTCFYLLCFLELHCKPVSSLSLRCSLLRAIDYGWLFTELVFGFAVGQGLRSDCPGRWHEREIRGNEPHEGTHDERNWHERRQNDKFRGVPQKHESRGLQTRRRMGGNLFVLPKSTLYFLLLDSKVWKLNKLDIVASHFYSTAVRKRWTKRCLAWNKVTFSSTESSIVRLF